jgi:hypothetical protein
LDDILVRFDGTREPLRVERAGHQGMDCPLPAHASTEVRNYFESLQAIPPEPEFIATLPGGCVFGPGIVLAPDGRSLARDVSTDFGKPFDQHWLLTYEKMRPPVHVPGSCGAVAVTLGEGYCHWLLEELPRLLILRGRLPEAVIMHTRTRFLQEALAVEKFATRIIEATRYSHFKSDQLIIPSLIGRLENPSGHHVDLLTAFTEPLCTGKATTGERLYISREKAPRRRVANENELWRHLEARRFTKLFLEELSWRDQINAFRHAKEIVAPHGAGLANLVFCQPGVRIVELFNREYINPCFWRLAGAKGLDYRVCISGGAGLPACDPQANRLDISVDIPAVMDALIKT